MTDRVGQQLGNYRLVRLLGKGGFAEVYLGEHRLLKNQAAIKVLHTALEGDDVDGFLHEAQVVARLKHPHIVHVFDFDIQDYTPFLIMDYFPRGNVRRSYPKGTLLPLMTVVSYVSQVASALEYAHNEHLIHRDIKPENMLLNQDHTVVLSDFGIALMAQSSHYQSTQEIAGTAVYMAPEQFRGKPRRASDQYALGVVTYEWLCGTPPFRGSFIELASQHLSAPVPGLCEKNSTILPAVEQVVLTVLAKDPKDRFATVQAFALALEQAYQEGSSYPIAFSHERLIPGQVSPETRPIATVLPKQSSPVTNLVTPPSQTVQPITSPHIPIVSSPSRGESPTASVMQLPKQRISRRTALIGMIGGVVMAGSTLTWLALSQRQHVSSTSLHSAAATPIPLGMTLVTYRGHRAEVSAIAWSPDSKHIASGSAYPDSVVLVWDASTGTLLFTYQGHHNGVGCLAWSPNGKYIVSAGSGVPDEAHVWDATTGNTLVTHHGFARTLAWSPDSRRIASPEDGAVQVWDATTGNKIYSHTSNANGGYAAYAIAWSPDGKHAASGGGDKTVQVWNASDGSPVYTYRGYINAVDAVAWSPDSKHIASSAWDNTVQVWDAATGNKLYTYGSHSGGVLTVTWSPNGRNIASGSFDKTVQVWNASDGSPVYTYRGHTGLVDAVAWSPDGTRIASAGRDNIVQVWQAP